jgi:sulfoacetaldehyde acetyltransferase
MAMAIAQNGPGVTGFVTAVKTAYWNHTPMLLVTPQAANKTIGQGGFQEVEQMALFRDMVCYQEEVRDPSRWPRCSTASSSRPGAPVGAGADQHAPRFLDPGDRHQPAGHRRFERPAGGERRSPRRRRFCRRPNSRSFCPAPAWCSATRSRDVRRAGRKARCAGLQQLPAQRPFPGKPPAAVGPLGYNGSKAAMELMAKADVVLALGTRLNPFSTLPGYGIDYWPKTAKIIQVDINADRIGLTKPVTVGICGDASWSPRAFSRGSRRRRRRRARGGRARRWSIRPSRNGCRPCPAWITRTTIRAPPGTRTPASATRT